VTSSPVQAVDAAYELLSFDPGREPDWAGFRSCFHPRALLALRVFPEDAAISVMDLREYARAQMRVGLKEEGYTEVPGHRDVDIIGSVATIRQHFTMNFAGPGHRRVLARQRRRPVADRVRRERHDGA
jgi:hypothetical protein